MYCTEQFERVFTMEIALFLFGYPLGILANISTDFLNTHLIGSNDVSLKKLFLKSLYKAIDVNMRRIDSVGKNHCKQIKQIIKQNETELFQIFNNVIGNNCIDISGLRNKSFVSKIVKKFTSYCRLSNTNLTEAILVDCLSFYEIAFFSNMTEKEGVQILIKLMNKLQSQVAQKADIEKLRQFIQTELQRRDDKSLNGTVDKDIYNFIYDEIAHPESESFSSSVTKHMAELRKRVAMLTNDQFQILQYLRYQKRVIISGCAGSGKTLLVAEKALRLDCAGINTLVLCHNPHLTNHIRYLTSGSSVTVFDFTSWIYTFLNKGQPDINDWNEYIEPLESEVDFAFDVITNSTISFDAVIVDEAQDFREVWWLIIESVLDKSQQKILYVFHDDNQSLLPYRSKYPIKRSPFSMSRNCRNGGEVFEIVKKFHPNAPITSQFLKGRGSVEISVFTENDHAPVIKKAVQDAYEHLNHNDLVVVTNEPSASNSILNEFKINRAVEWDWREVVRKDLNSFRSKFLKKISTLKKTKSDSEIASTLGIPLKIRIEDYIKMPAMSSEQFPNSNDVKLVRGYSNKFSLMIGMNFNPYFAGDKISWFKDAIGFSLKAKTHTGRMQNATVKDKIIFYSSKDWALNMPLTRPLKFVANSFGAKFNEDQIPLFSVNSYKGLESEAVVLFINSLTERINSEMYVGTSRAIGYLHIVVSSKVLSSIMQLRDREYHQYSVP